MSARSLIGALAAFALVLAACNSEQATTESAEDQELTSNTALARDLRFTGYVFTDASSSDDAVLATVKKQTQSAFGAFREANVGANSREFRDVDAKTFVKTKVALMDASGKKVKDALRVDYTYTDTALVPKSMAKRSSLSLGLLTGNYQWQSKRVVDECTTGDKHAQEFIGSVWYVFNPSLTKCKTAMAKEQQVVDADRKKLKSPKSEIVQKDFDRLYVPMTARLTGNKTNTGTTWPEYDRLWSGGVQKDTVVVAMVNGLMADWAAGEKFEPIDDDGYPMWFEGLREVFAGHTYTLKSVEPAGDVLSYALNGKTWTAKDFNELMRWELDGQLPSGLSYSDERSLRNAVATRLMKRWLTFEAKVKGKIGTAAERAVTIRLQTYFGAETDSAPHKRGIKTADVFIYNGHSYIGYGPLDPKKFSKSDFPASYQILFGNGCVSYNCYEKDYWALKTGGSANLELVTNGLESWVNGSGPAMGRFVKALLDGKQNNYNQLLKAAEFTGYGYSWGQDALRVVDGELDNKYKPSATAIVVKD
jgi:hypothetical protein